MEIQSGSRQNSSEPAKGGLGGYSTGLLSLTKANKWSVFTKLSWIAGSIEFIDCVILFLMFSEMHNIDMLLFFKKNWWNLEILFWGMIITL